MREESDVDDAVDGRRQARRDHGADGVRRREGGRQVANEIVRDTARYLGAGIANLLNIFNPDTSSWSPAA